MKVKKDKKVYDFENREVTITNTVKVRKINYRNLAIAIMVFIVLVMVLGLIILYLISRMVKFI